MFRPILIAGLVSILPTILQAQGRAVMSVGPRPMAAAPRGVAHVTQPAGTPAVPRARVVPRTGTPRLRMAERAQNTRRPAGTRRHLEADEAASSSDFIPVPGLGFDMTHLAATRGAAAVGLRRHQPGFQLLFPFLDGGVFLPSAPVVAEESTRPEPQQAEEPEAETAETPQRARLSGVAQTAELGTAKAALRQPEEFVFVRRDGTVFFAVAYAWENGTLRYITSEGLRRTLARDALDLDATQQFNEQRGMNFRLPA
jgi:hypothetical protein